MAKFKPASPSDSDSLETQKLKLEIIQLRRNARWKLTPAITALISVAGLLVSVWLFGRQQASEQEKNRIARELERRTTLQNRISSDTDEILRFPGDPKLTISRVAFLLADIQSMLNSPIYQTTLDPKDRQLGKLADVLPEKYQDHLTRSLVILVRDECDLSRRARDAGVARAISQYWTDYAGHLAKNPQKLNYVLWSYSKALVKFHRQNRGYLESFVRTEDEIEPGSQYKRRPDEDLRWGHVLDLSDGFKEHLKILCRGTEPADVEALRQRHFEEFQKELSNPIVSDFLLQAKTDKEFCESMLRKEK